jgi:hypothetical protein
MKPTLAQVAHTTNVTIDVPAVVYDNACIGEPVALHGSLHLVVGIASDQAGGSHIGSHLNGSYTGTGLVSGVRYRASDNQQDVWNTRELPGSHTITMRTRLISQGGVDNAFLFTIVTTTIDADGVPTATVDNQWVECRG